MNTVKLGGIAPPASIPMMGMRPGQIGIVMNSPGSNGTIVACVPTPRLAKTGESKLVVVLGGDTFFQHAIETYNVRLLTKGEFVTITVD